jgi:hypothetical protein
MMKRTMVVQQTCYILHCFACFLELWHNRYEKQACGRVTISIMFTLYIAKQKASENTFILR